MTTTHDVPMPEPVVLNVDLDGGKVYGYTADQVRDTAIAYADARCAKLQEEALSWRRVAESEKAERDALAEKVKAMEDNDRRYRWLKKKAHQKTAHDIYGNGAFWQIGIHSEDQRLDFDDAIDAAGGGEA